MMVREKTLIELKPWRIFYLLVLLGFLTGTGLIFHGAFAQEPERHGSESNEGFVGLIEMKMMILPGTEAFLQSSIEQVHQSGGRALVVELDTPGGIVQNTMNMAQIIFQSPVPVIIYVAPSGATATSAGVFLTMAGHVAAMAPGTSIGAAHPVASSGEDIEGDMRQKAENMAAAMVKSITEERGRDPEWVELAVRESVSITEREALEKKVIDLIAKDVPELLEKLEGRTVKIQGQEQTLKSLSHLPVRRYEMNFRDQALNVLSNPNVAALLWLGATTGLSIELYNPGLILPGVVGLICLVLALAVTQLIPLSTGALMLTVLGSLLIGLDIFVGSMVLGIGGIVALVLGLLYLVDVGQAPGLAVSWELLGPIAASIGGLMMYMGFEVSQAYRKPGETGVTGLIGKHGDLIEPLSPKGKVFVHGEYWDAVAKDGSSPSELVVGRKIIVVGVHTGFTLVVEPFSSTDA